MSLAVWLPLNGDLHNQGLSNITVTNNGATIDNNGKIGKCYSFNGNDSYISLSSNKLYDIFKGGSQPFSISFWVYHADTTRAVLFGDYALTGTINFNIELTVEHKIRFYWGSSPDKSFTPAITQAQWTHIVLTYDGSKILFFKDGILQSDKYSNSLAVKNKTSGVFYLGRDSRTGTTALNGRLNDFRIYDHTLSPKEVEEIAKGLVLHYPLNNNGLGNANLALNTFYEMRPYTISSYYKRTNNTSTDFFNLSVGDTYTCRAKITAGEKDTRLRIQFYTDNNIRTAIFGNWVPAGTTGYSTITSTLTAEQRNHSLMEIFLDDGVNASTSGEYGELKLEKGSIATPWCPNNINTNIIYDTSGYCNNGIVVGDIATITPSPKYNCCIEHLDSCADYIYREYLSFLGDSGFTFSCWINPTSYSSTTNTTTAVGNQFILSQGRDTRTSGTNNTRGASLIIYNGKPQFFCGNGSLDSNTTIPIGEWAHVVGVWTGTQKKIYVNGILKNSANDTGIDWIEAQNSLVIGKMAYRKNSTSSFYPFVGKISDVRIYATALTNKQIKKLYNTSMQIDSSGNVYARELVEL